MATAPNDSEYDYDGLKGLASELKRPVSTLIALSAGNDPFYAGAPARLRNAEWFAELWDRFQFPRGIHLRGIFYVLVSQREPVRFPDGTVFENTVECWQGLGKAAKDARHLDLVPSDYWIDRKSAAVVHLVDPTEAEITIGYRTAFGWDASPDMPELPQLRLERPEIAQPYHIELWCEKTTINDILMSLAEQYGLNVITGEGEISATQCDQLVSRAVEFERPVRILYISDFDPAGQSMPVAVARKIEHALYRRGLDDLDIQVRPVALTKEQVIEFDIPPIPLKESENRAAGFREQHGDLAAAQLGRDYGQDFQWVVYDVLGQPQDRLYNQHMRNHWVPVQRGDFDGALDHIDLEYGGQRLCSRSTEISKKAREYHLRKARDAVAAMREGAIGGNLPGVTLDSRHPSALKSNRINKTYEPLNIPSED